MSKKSGTSGFETIIGKNTILEGNIKTQSSARFEGKVIGNVVANGTVFIGKQSVINGNIDAKDVFLCGAVNGNVKATGLLKIQSTAKLCGDINVNSFVADEGSLFKGTCSMMESVPKKNKANKINKKKIKKNRRKLSVSEDLYEGEENKAEIL